MFSRVRSSGTDRCLDTGITGTRSPIRAKVAYDFGVYPPRPYIVYDDPDFSDCSLPLMFSDKKEISDVIGNRNGYNGCSHTRDFSLEIGIPAERQMSQFSIDQLPTDGSWRTVGWDYGPVGGKFSLQAALPDVSSQITCQFQPIDWSLLVQGVGEALDGQMQARTSILVVLAELEQTLGMIKNPFGLLTARWRRSRKTLRQLSKAGANVWLEYKYGWKNFFNDAKNLFLAIKESRQHVLYLMSTRDSWASIARRSVDEVPYSVPNPHYISSQYEWSLSNLVARRIASFSLDILRGEHFRVLSSREYALQGMGGDKVIEALWDLVPFSFVVDWFIDIQRVLSLKPILWGLHNLRRVGYAVSTRYSADLEIVRRGVCDIGGVQTMSFAMPNQVVRKTYVRTPGFPPSTITTGIFGGLNLTHTIDASALFAQRL